MIDGKEFDVDVAYAMHEESVLASVELHLASTLRASRRLCCKRYVEGGHEYIASQINKAARRMMLFLYGGILDCLREIERGAADGWSHDKLVSQVRALQSRVESSCRDVDVVTTEVAEEIVQAVKTMGGGK
jgi:hypothetical protein